LLSLSKTIACFVLALFLVALIILGATLISTMGIGQALNVELAWQILLQYVLATAHKLGVVAIILALIYHYTPPSLPRFVLTVALAFPIGALYNYIQLVLMESSANEQLATMSTGQIFQAFLIYYGMMAALLAFIGGLLCKYLEKRQLKK